jgi:N utilization substance protein B
MGMALEHDSHLSTVNKHEIELEQLLEAGAWYNTTMTSDGQHTSSPRNTRREAREMTLRILYQIDLGKQSFLQSAKGALKRSYLDHKNRRFAMELARGVLEHEKELDVKISTLSKEWALDRQPVIDRNILRMGAYELIYAPDSPIAAIVNEAVELANKYSTAESGKYVNGVLGALARNARSNPNEVPSKEG